MDIKIDEKYPDEFYRRHVVGDHNDHALGPVDKGGNVIEEETEEVENEDGEMVIWRKLEDVHNTNFWPLGSTGDKERIA